MVSFILMNAYIIENFMTSFSFILLIFVAVLILSVFILLLRISTKNNSNRTTLERLRILQRAFQISPSAILIVNQTGRILLANNSASALFDLPEEELRQQFLDAFTVIQSSKKLSTEMQESLRTEDSYETESLIKIDGKQKLCSFTIYSLESKDKSEYMVIVTPKRDRTRRVFEQNLLSARLDEVENAAGIGFWVYDYDTGETIWSRGLYKLLAKPLNKSKPDLSFLSQFSPESQKSIQRLLLAIKNQESFYDRLSLIDDNGNIRTVDLYLKHQVGLDLNIRKSMGVFREVRETSINESILNYFLPETDFKELEDVLLITTDKDGKISYLNNKALTIIDSDLNDLIGADAVTVLGERVESNDKTHFSSKINGTIIKWQTFHHENTNEKSYLGLDLNTCASELERYEKLSRDAL